VEHFDQPVITTLMHVNMSYIARLLGPVFAKTVIVLAGNICDKILHAFYWRRLPATWFHHMIHNTHLSPSHAQHMYRWLNLIKLDLKSVQDYVY